MTTHLNENTKNETIYGWWQRSYNDKSNSCFAWDSFNYFKDDVKNKKTTFARLLEAMKSPDTNVYDLCGIGDSEVRIAIFRRLCELYNLEYETIYDLWLGGLPRAKREAEKTACFIDYTETNLKTFLKKVENASGTVYSGYDSVEKLKAHFAKLLDDCERLYTNQ